MPLPPPTAGQQRIAVESWSPEYGSPLADGVDEAGEVAVDVDIEFPAAQWRPVSPDGPAAPRCAFVDGARRVDARVVLYDDGEDTVRSGIAATVAAGVVVTEGPRAQVVDCAVERWLIVAGVESPLNTRHGHWRPRPTRDDDPATVTVELQQAMADLEVGMATAAADADLVVIDGPIRRREAIRNGVGHIKTHHRTYLQSGPAAVVAQLGPGQRTPLFRISGGGDRYAWYLRLPGPNEHAWSGIVRGEAPGRLSMAEAVTLADRAATTLARFASHPAKDPRAPQNLVPVGGLEHRLRHRMGDPQLLYRALRVAAASGQLDAS